MPNIANINTLIERIRADQGRHLTMGGFVSYIDENSRPEPDIQPTKMLDCKTAFCICGYANLLRMEQEGTDYRSVVGVESTLANDFAKNDFLAQFGSQQKAGDWLEIDSITAHYLFYMNDSDQRSWFDNEAEPQKRADAAIAVLEHLRDTGHVDWNSALMKTVDSDGPRL